MKPPALACLDPRYPDEVVIAEICRQILALAYYHRLIAPYEEELQAEAARALDGELSREELNALLLLLIERRRMEDVVWHQIPIAGALIHAVQACDRGMLGPELTRAGMLAHPDRIRMN